MTAGVSPLSWLFRGIPALVTAGGMTNIVKDEDDDDIWTFPSMGVGVNEGTGGGSDLMVVAVVVAVV